MLDGERSSGIRFMAAGFKQSRFRPQGREGAAKKLEGFCQVVEEAVALGHKDID